MSHPHFIPYEAVNLTPAVMARAIVARATPDHPTYGVQLTALTSVSQGHASRLLAEMRERGEADYGDRFQKSAAGRTVDPVVGTELLNLKSAEDAHLRRAIGVIDFAQRLGVSPGEALDELLRIGRATLEATNQAE